MVQSISTVHLLNRLGSFYCPYISYRTKYYFSYTFLEIFLTIPDEQMYAEVLSIVLKALKSEFGTFGYFNKDGSFSVPATTREIYWEKCNILDKEIIFQRGSFSGIWNRAIEEKKTLYSNKGPFNTPKGHVPIKNTMVTPIYYRGKLLSAIHIASKATDYDERDKALLETVAGHIAPVLYARLEREREQKKRKKAEAALRGAKENLELQVNMRTAELTQANAALRVEITERKCMEEELQKSEQQFRGTFEQAAVGIVHATLDGTFIRLNQRFCDITGYTQDELRKLTFRDITHLDDIDKEIETISKILETDLDTASFDKRYLCKDGSIVWANLTVSLMRTQAGKPEYVIGVVKDITERKQAEEALRKEKVFAESIVQTAQAIVLVLDPTGRIINFNPYMEKIFGYRIEQVRGKDWFDTFLPKQDRHRMRELFSKAVSDIQTQGNINPIVTKDGELRQIEWYDKTLKDANGKLIGLLAIGQDITERKQTEERLRYREEKFRTLVTNIPDVTWTSDNEGNTTFISSNIKEIYGYSPDEIYKRGEELWFGRIHPDDIENVKRSYGSLFETTGFRYDIEYRIKKKDGEWIWLHDRSIATYEKDGVTYADGILTDITERKQEKEALQISEANLVKAQEVAHVGSWSLDLLENNLVWTDEIYRIFGVSKGTPMTYEKFIAHVHPEDRTLVEERWSAALNKEPYNIEHRIVVAGTVKWVNEQAEVTFDETGNAVFAIGTVQDITERKKAEEDIASQAKLLDLILKNSLDSIVLLDKDYNFIWVSEAYAKACHRDSSEFAGHNHFEFYPSNLKEEFDAAKKRKSIYRKYARPFIFPDHPEWGTTYWDLGLVPIFDDDGEIEMFLFTLKDITELKQSEENLHQLREELLHATRVGTMSEFTAALAHEINHPLGSILNNANAAKRFLENKKPDLDEVREIIDDIISEDRRANDVIQKLRDLMKKADSKYTPLKINVIIEEVLSLTHSELVIEGISLSKQLEKNLPKVEADRIQLQQVLLNFIINAADAMKESKVKNLSVSTSKKGSQDIIVCVMDSGVGFDENKKDNLFKPFFTTKKEGMGMGLSVNKTIIKAFGGDVWAENNKDGGASFFITLPIYKEKSS